MNGQKTLKFQQLPYRSWLIGILLLGYSGGYYYFHQPARLTAFTALLAVIGLAFLIVASGRTVSIDGATRTLRIVGDWRLFWRGKIQKIAFDNLVDLRINSFRARPDSWVEVVTRDSSIIVITPVGSRDPQKTLEQLREIIGLKNDPAGTTANVYQRREIRMPITGLEHEQVTGGVKWYLLPSSIKDSSYWFSPDLRLKTGLLWISYELSPNNRLLFTRYPRQSDIKALEAVFSYWGFLPKVLPNFALAEMLEELKGAGDTHFDLLAIHPAEARQIITAETQAFVLKWSQQ
ncbi:MAG TPA: hypothetical protein VK249_23385, partial [Anaerolineales bacterium]|nr:hypothetical protein [Anaerolineales bacterium]